MLLVSWVEKEPDVFYTHILTLYHVELVSYKEFSVEATDRNHHRFAALEPCSLYVVCVEIADTYSSTCLSTITGTDKLDFSVLHLYCINPPLPTHTQKLVQG